MDQTEEVWTPIKDSGIITDFEEFLRSQLPTKNDVDDELDDSDVNEEQNNLDDDEFNANFDEDAHNFIEQPSCSNIFYPNLKRAEMKLFKNNGIRSFKSFLRNALECEMNQEDRNQIFGIVSPNEIGNSSQSESVDFSENHFERESSCVSPDLFSCSSSDDENIPNCHNTVATIVNKSRNQSDLIVEAENFMIKLLKDLVENNIAHISVINCDTWQNSEVSNGILTHKDPSELIHRNVNLKNLNSRFHFAMIMYVLSEIYHLLITGLTCTERELYYNNPELEKNQAAIKSAIKDVCGILNASPWELGICQSSKGLVAGAIKIHMSDNVVIDCYTMYDRATLIPSDIQAITFLETTAKCVLIVEKDTIFEKILQQNILLNLNVDIILITGKGYPDLGTRLLVKRIWEDFHLPIYALVDADPFGIEIMFVYRYGSKAMAFSAELLACPQIRWIGIQPSEIEMLAIPSAPQTKEDKKKIIELLQRKYISSEIRHELEILQKLDRKAEIEGVASFSANFLVCDYIPNKIRRNLVI